MAVDADSLSAFRHEQEILAASNPRSFLTMCLAHCIEEVQDYRCIFRMRERQSGRLPDEQVIEIAFRERPYSVDMRWVRNAAGAKRVNFVADRWVRNGRQLALIVPSGLGMFVAPAGIKLDIRGPEVRAASPRAIDQFGFRKTLERIINVCNRAAESASCELQYVGRGEVDRRPCYVFERRLPYAGPRGPFPDHLSVIHIDAEWLVPTGVWTYADDDRQTLLGSFVTTDVQMNVGLGDRDFD